MYNNNYPPGVGPWTVLPGEEEGACCRCGATHCLAEGYAEENGDRVCAQCWDTEIDEEIDERGAATAEVFTTIHVLDDGETWAGDGCVLELTEAQYNRVCEGEHPRDVVKGWDEVNGWDGSDYEEDLEDCPMYAPKPPQVTEKQRLAAQAVLYTDQFRWVSVTTPTGESVQVLVPRAQGGEK